MEAGQHGQGDLGALRQIGVIGLRLDKQDWDLRGHFIAEFKLRLQEQAVLVSGTESLLLAEQEHRALHHNAGEGS